MKSSAEGGLRLAKGTKLGDFEILSLVARVVKKLERLEMAWLRILHGLKATDSSWT